MNIKRKKINRNIGRNIKPINIDESNKEEKFIIHNNRFVILPFFVLLLFSLLILVIFFYLYIFKSDFFKQQAEKRSSRNIKDVVARSSILDRNGNVLAISILLNNVIINPRDFLRSYKSNSLEFIALSKGLGLNPKDLFAKIELNSKREYLIVAKKVNNNVINYLKSLNISSLRIEKEYSRIYPYGASVAQLIGFNDIDGNGIEGIELSFNNQLKSIPGYHSIEKDIYNNVIEYKLDKSVEARHGKDVILSIDINIQNVMYDYLLQAISLNKAESAAAVLVSIKTGEIIGMANAPSYNPNNRPKNISSYRNIAITDSFEPGSTVKPFVVLNGLDQKVINVNSVIDTQPYTLNNKLIEDISKNDKLDIEGILAKSSNIGVSKIALKTPIKTLIDIYTRVGFGQPINIGLEGAAKGIFPSNNKRWSNLDIAVFSFGYMQTVTPLQLAKAYSILGNYGNYVPLSILRVDKEVTSEQVLNRDNSKKVVELLKSVARPGGGGIRAKVDEYTVAVKTGTAKKVENGKYTNKYIAYTAGVAPAKDPKYALVVIVNNPRGKDYYGGAVSAPVFSKIMTEVLRYYNIQEDEMSSNRVILTSKVSK